MSYYYNTPPTQSAFSVYFSNRFDDREVFAVQTAWQQLWATRPPRYTGDVTSINIDIVKGNQRTSVLVKRGAQNGEDIDRKVMEDGKFANLAWTLPLAEEVSQINSNELNFRRAGENPFTVPDQMTHARNIAQDKYGEHTRKIIRLNEYQAAYAMQNGKHLYILGDTTDVIDFGRHADNSFASAGEWDDTGGDPFVDLEAAIIQALETGHVAPTMCIMSPEAAKAFITNSVITGNADIRNYNFIMAGRMPVPTEFQRFVDGGFAYLGSVTLPRGYTLQLFVDNGTYDNSSGTSTVYMTAKSIILCNPNARYDLYVGPFDKFPMTDSERSFMQSQLGISPGLVARPANTNMSFLPAGAVDHDLYFSAERKVLNLRTQSSLIFAPVHINSIVQVTACAL